MEKETRGEITVEPGRGYQEEMLWRVRRNAEPWLEPDSFMCRAVRGDQVRTFDGVYVFWCLQIHVEQKIPKCIMIKWEDWAWEECF